MKQTIKAGKQAIQTIQTAAKAVVWRQGMFYIGILIIGLALTLWGEEMANFSTGCAELRQDVLRLHILANSNQPQDQAIKLKVRDRLLKEGGALLCGGDKTKQGAMSQAACHLEELTAIAQDEVYRQGSKQKVRVQLKKMYFETRSYGSFTMPAGQYDALRVTIGAGEGKNWWCVMFPPLCIPAAVKETEALDYFTQRELQVLQQPVYEPKFAIVELVQRLHSKEYKD